MGDTGPHDVIVIMGIVSPISAVGVVEAVDEVGDDGLVRSGAGPGGHIDGHFDHLGVLPEVLSVKAAPGLPHIVAAAAVVEVPVEVEREVVCVGGGEGPGRRGNTQKREYDRSGPND